MNKQSNIVIVGAGGQGLITLLKVISEAALQEGYEVRTSELHGLSQRGGSVEVHVRFGEKIYSPLVEKGKADLVISLELQEALRAINYSSDKTNYLINNFSVQIANNPPLTVEQVKKGLGFAKEVIISDASEVCQKELDTAVVAGIYLLGEAVSKGLLPLKSESIISAIKKVVPEKFLELNLKAFNLEK
jgi:indolepyruvate ferredoxin oxidoreductase beta subunit